MVALAWLSVMVIYFYFVFIRQRLTSLCTFAWLFAEVTHGFDDKGRQFDKDGNMMQWWNNATIRNFRERAQCIIDQYSRYRIDEVGLYMNGRMTQGELCFFYPFHVLDRFNKLPLS